MLYLRELVAPGEITEEVMLRFMENDSTGWIESQALLLCGYCSNASELTQRRGEMDQPGPRKLQKRPCPSATIDGFSRETGYDYSSQEPHL